MTKTIVATMALLTLISCAEQLSSQEKLEFLAGTKLCAEAEVTEVPTESNEPLFRFDKIYQFEVVARRPCLMRFEESVDRLHQCRKYPNQLACDVKGSGILILNRVEKGISITYST